MKRQLKLGFASLSAIAFVGLSAIAALGQAADLGNDLRIDVADSDYSELQPRLFLDGEPLYFELDEQPPAPQLQVSDEGFEFYRVQESPRREQDAAEAEPDPQLTDERPVPAP